MGKNNVKSTGYTSSFGRLFTLVLFSSSAFSARTNPQHTDESNEVTGGLPPSLPSTSPFVIPTHTKIWSSSGQEPTWQQIYQVSTTPFPEDRKTADVYFKHVFSTLKREEDPEKYKRVYPYLKHLVTYHARKIRTSDHLKLDLGFYTEKFSLITHGQASSDDVDVIKTAIRTEVTDAQMILAAYQVGKRHANWIRKNGMNNLYKEAVRVSNHLKDSNHGADILERYYQCFAIMASEIIKQQSATNVAEANASDGVKEASILNVDVRVIHAVEPIVTEFYNAIYREPDPETGEKFELHAFNEANNMLMSLIKQAYIDYAETQFNKACAAPQQVSEKAEDSLDETQEELSNESDESPSFWGEIRRTLEIIECVTIAVGLGLSGVKWMFPKEEKMEPQIKKKNKMK